MRWAVWMNKVLINNHIGVSLSSLFHQVTECGSFVFFKALFALGLLLEWNPGLGNDMFLYGESRIITCGGDMATGF